MTASRLEFDGAGDLPVPFGWNCFHFGNNYRRRQFAGFENVLEVLRDGGNSHTEEIGDGALQKSCGKCLPGGFCGGEGACYDGDREKSGMLEPD